MIDLSVVIVNYNVKHFLEQCISSLRPALKKISAEIIVVDNASVDGSVAHIKKQFPEVYFIENRENLGFSKANNQGIKQSGGEFILLLNPDTIIQEETLQHHLQYLKEHEDVGCLGTKMIDGSGHYLPESKRGFPGPRTALFKMLGLNKIFPGSKFFNYYHLGHLDKDQIQEVDVLSGAYLLLRRSVLDEVGLLDEAFFMYGEDIDLSFRIKKSGYKLIYHPEYPIIHYKGESTKKGSFNYVKHFYQAMIIFAGKHFKQQKARMLVRVLSAGIYLRAALSLVKAVFQKIGMLLLYGICIYGSLFAIALFWARYKFQDPDYYQDAPLILNFLLYALVWTVAGYFSKLFSRTAQFYSFLKNIILSSLILFAVYGFLDTDYRSSRAILLMGTICSFILGFILQYLWNYTQERSWRFSGKQMKNAVIVGSLEECSRVHRIIEQSDAMVDIRGYVSPEVDIQSSEYLTDVSRLSQLADIEDLNEIIFCLRDLNIHEVMHQMSSIGGFIEYKIIGDESLSIVGSKSKNTPGEWYSVDLQFKLNKRSSLISKRIFDLVASLILLFFSPLLWIFQTKRSDLFKNILDVLLGRKTLVSYSDIGIFKEELPQLKAGILHPLTGKTVSYMKPLSMKRANLLYAKDYHWNRDLEILWRGILHLGGEKTI